MSGGGPAPGRRGVAPGPAPAAVAARDEAPLADSAAQLRATAYVLASACCFGSVVAFTELAKSAGATLLTVLTWRYLAGALLLLLLGGLPALARVPRRRRTTLLVAGGVGQATVAYLSLRALDYIPAATVSFLFYTYPSWVAVFAVLRGSEPVDRVRVAALALSLGGIVLMVGSPWSAPLDPRGVLLALAAALAYALFIPMLARLQTGVGATLSSALVALGAGALFAAAALASRSLSVTLPPLAWFWIAALAVVCIVLAFITFLRGLAVLGPVRTAIVSTVEPFWTLLLAVPALGQPLRPATAAGGVLIAAAVLILQRQRRGA